MAVSIGKNAIHLGWEVAVSVLISLIAATWQLSSYFSEFMQSQREIKKELAILINRDSIHGARIEVIATDSLSHIRTELNQVNTVLPIILDALKNNRRIRFYNERKVNGSLYVVPYPTSNNP